MDEIVKNVMDKISSYNIFNNLLSGTVFCCIVQKTTRFSFAEGDIWERIFVYYFLGIIISRVGSMIVEKILRKLKVKNRNTGKKEPFLQFAKYEDYIEASENQSFIKTLNQENNVYRTMISMLILGATIKMWDWLIYEKIKQFGVIGDNYVCMGSYILLIILFVFSYKKQTQYIRRRVEKYIAGKEQK